MKELENIIHLVEQYTSIDDLKLKLKKRDLTEARGVYYELARTYTNKTLEEIAKSVNVTSASVINGINKFRNSKDKVHFRHPGVYEQVRKILLIDNNCIDEIKTLISELEILTNNLEIEYELIK